MKNEKPLTIAPFHEQQPLVKKYSVRCFVIFGKGVVASFQTACQRCLHDWDRWAKWEQSGINACHQLTEAKMLAEKRGGLNVPDLQEHDVNYVFRSSRPSTFP